MCVTLLGGDLIPRTFPVLRRAVRVPTLPFMIQPLASPTGLVYQTSLDDPFLATLRDTKICACEYCIEELGIELRQIYFKVASTHIGQRSLGHKTLRGYFLVLQLCVFFFNFMLLFQ